MPVSEAKGALEDGARTFGIEVEFATHNYELLSFTHIEVCYLYPKGMPMERLQTDAWKIETDSYYTFELVSPILSFKNRGEAEQFKKDLLQKLQSFVSNASNDDERKLGTFLDKLKEFLSEKLTYKSESHKWEEKQDGHSLKTEDLIVSYIGKDELLSKINWENWDDYTDLKAVLAEKKRISDEEDNNSLAFKLADILLYPSSKNNYFCDSQMNVPQTLKEYVIYQAKHKLTKAIKRIEGEVSEDKKYGEVLMPPSTESFLVYNAEDERARFERRSNAIGLYNTARVERKRDSANKYYAWLRVFSHATEKVVDEMRKKTILEGGELGKRMPWENFSCSNGMEYMIAMVWSKPIYQVIYLIVQKLVFGTLGQLSETLQMRAQQEIMSLAELSMQQPFGSILMKDKNGGVFEHNLFNLSDYKAAHPFLDYYSFVKDLTPLWFKAPLLDVLAASDPNDQGIVLQLLLNQNINITQLVQEAMEETEARVKESDGDFTMLDVEGNKNAVKDAYATFHETMQQTEAALKQYLTTKQERELVTLNLDNLQTRLSSRDTLYIARAEDVKGVNLMPGGQRTDLTIEFLKREYAVFYNEKSAPVTVSVAPWEARWDTLKAPIRLPESGSTSSSDSEMYYLVEHRNN